MWIRWWKGSYSQGKRSRRHCRSTLYCRATEDLSAIVLEHTPHDACRMGLGFKRVEHFNGTPAVTRRVAREVRPCQSQRGVDREQAACIASRRVVIEIDIVDLDRRTEG